MNNQIIKALKIKPSQIISTHSAWVILTGEFAYKIKKPVDFEFLDYSTLEKRRHYCEEEIRLNQRLAPELYEEIIPIKDENGSIIEYAIKMREFPQEQLFSQLLAHNQLQPSYIDALAKSIASFHQTIEIAGPDMFYGTPEQLREAVLQNFDQIRPFLKESSDKKQLDYLEKLETHEYPRLYPFFQKRKKEGFIRACHGDLYLNNIVLLDNQPILFDCIEFNESFRWTDTMADLGFITMDLDEKGRADYASRLISRYMEISNDYEGLYVLPYYQAYRTIVRAKVALFQQPPAWENYKSGMNLAECYAEKRPQPQLIIMHGLSGSGKSTRAGQLVEKFSGIQIRSDVERKRIGGLSVHERSHSAINANLYTKDLTEKTYQRLYELANLILHAGYSVIVDATFLQAKHRSRFQTLAEQFNYPFHIANCEMNPEILKTRLMERTADVSEANLAVLEMQRNTLEPLTERERDYLLV